MLGVHKFVLMFLHPYSLVKDNRSLYESNNPKDVLDGNLDDFIYAYLKSRIQEVVMKE